LDSLAHLAYMSAFSVVKNAIIEHQLYISQKVTRLQVLIIVQLLLDCAQVHGLFHNIEIVGDVKLHWVYWFVEDP
jgi:hypothetical protein